MKINRHKEIWVIYELYGAYNNNFGTYYGITKMPNEKYKRALRRIWREFEYDKRKNIKKRKKKKSIKEKPMTFKKYKQYRNNSFKVWCANDFVLNYKKRYKESDYLFKEKETEKDDKLFYKKIKVCKVILNNQEKAWKYRKHLIKTYSTILLGLNLPEDTDFELDYIEETGEYCVYCHIAPNGKRYIGMTKFGKNPNRRWDNGRGYVGQDRFYNAIKKYGWKNFKHEILKENLNFSSACYWETYYIKEYNTIKNGYNILGGKYDKIFSEMWNDLFWNESIKNSLK